jgi:hypothetical protein
MELLHYFDLHRTAHNKLVRIVEIMKGADQPLEAIINHWTSFKPPAQASPVITRETHPELFKVDEEGRQVINWQHNDPAPPDADLTETES